MSNTKKRMVVEQSSRETTTIINEGALLSGRYRLTKELGRGGMGIVYLAEDLELDSKPVAVKLLPPELATSKAAIKRLKKEAIAAIELTHENIMRLQSFETDGDTAYLVLEYIDGEPLDERLAEIETFTYDETLAIMKQTVAGLTAAHRQKIIHRDIKPANLMYKTVGDEKVIRIADFGIAFVVKDSMTRLTGTDSAGTLSYIAPEQLKGDRPTDKSDQYSLAATAYELLSGEPPFVGAGLSHQIINATPKPIPDVPEHANVALLKALSKKPEDRFDNLNGFLDAFSGKEKTSPQNPSKSNGLYKTLMCILGGTILFLAITAILKQPQTRVPIADNKIENKAAVLLENKVGFQKAFKMLAEKTKTQSSEAAWKEFREFCERNNANWRLDESWLQHDEPLLEEIKWLKIAVKRKIPNAMSKFAELMIYGRLVEKNQKQAIKLLQEAEQLGCASALVLLGFCYERELGVPFDGLKATEYYHKAIKIGHVKGAFLLGDCYQYGFVLKQNLEQACGYYRIAADQHYSQAKAKLAFLRVLNGQNVKDSLEELELQEKRGCLVAINGLGIIYYGGKGVEQSYTKAKELYTAAASKGDEKAFYNLALYYFKGRSEEGRNISKAQEYCVKAAEFGFPSAVYLLGSSFEIGNNGQKNPTKALSYYKKAARLGEKGAMVKLASLYIKGMVVKKDLKKAQVLLEKAANKGHLKAREMLSKLVGH